jgi:hypothetical protein
MKMKEAINLAKEWADALSGIAAPPEAVRDAIIWGFDQVEGGRDAASVLKEVTDRIHANKKDVRLH